MNRNLIIGAVAAAGLALGAVAVGTRMNMHPKKNFATDVMKRGKKALDRYM